MIARITRGLILAQLAVAAGLFTLLRFSYGIRPWLAVLLSITAVVLVRSLITANNFVMAARYRGNTDNSERLSWRRRCGQFAEEFRSTMFSSSWSMPFFRFEQWLSEQPAGLPVLLVHGWGCNSGYWHVMSRALRLYRISHRAVDLEPVLASIDAYSPAIHQAVEALCQASGSERIVIVAHSMGGLAARAYLRDYGSARVAKIITLASPHHGTGLANFAPGLNSRQMRWTGNASAGTQSDWLQQLENSESVALRRLFISIYSKHDNIIAPAMSSELAGAVNIGFSAIGHVAIAFNPAIHACVIDAVLQEPEKYQNTREYDKKQ
jgi:triacylglycerol lipase